MLLTSKDKRKEITWEKRTFWTLMGHDSSLHDFLSTGGVATEDLVLAKWKPRVVLIPLVMDPILGDFLHIEGIHGNLLESILILESWPCLLRQRITFDVPKFLESGIQRWQEGHNIAWSHTIIMSHAGWTPLGTQIDILILVAETRHWFGIMLGRGRNLKWETKH